MPTRRRTRLGYVCFDFITKGADGVSEEKDLAGEINRHLAAAADKILPLAVCTGILTALSFVTDVYAVSPLNFGGNTPVAQFFRDLSEIISRLILPLWSACIACSVARRAGFYAGFVGGAIVCSGGAGFWAAMAAGFIAGYMVNYGKKNFTRLPQNWRECRFTVIYPLFAIIVTGYVAMYILNPPAGSLFNWLPDNLSRPVGDSPALTGFILGALPILDINGPWSRGAWFTGASLLTDGECHVMARVMAGEMVPPLVIAVTALWRRKIFTPDELACAKLNFFCGLTAVIMGVFPFAARDPWRVVPACLIGSGIAGALTATFDCTIYASAGGILAAQGLNSPALFVVAVAVGTVTGAAIFMKIKK